MSTTDTSSLMESEVFITVINKLPYLKPLGKTFNQEFMKIPFLQMLKMMLSLLLFSLFIS